MTSDTVDYPGLVVGSLSSAHEAEERVASREPLNSFLRRLVSARSDNAAAQAAVDTARTLLHVDVSWIGVLSDGALSMCAHSGLHTVRMAETWRLPLGDGIGGRVALESRALAVRDYRHDPRRAPVMKSLIDEERIHAALCVPLVDGKDVLGVLYVADRTAHDWTAEHFSALAELARDTGAALRRIREVSAANQQAAADRECYQRAQQALTTVRTLAVATARAEELDTPLAMLAHQLGMHVEAFASPGELAVGQAGVGHDLPVRVHTDGDEHLIGTLRVRGPRDLDLIERELVTATSAIVSLQLLRHRETARSELRAVSEFVEDLLEGRGDARSLQSRASMIGVDLDEPHHVVRVGAHRPDDSSAVPVLDRETVEHLAKVARVKYPRSLIVPLDGDVLVLLPPGEHGIREVCASLADMVQPTAGFPVSLAAGLGRLSAKPEDYVDSSAEAVLALDLARRRREPGGVMTPRDLGIYGLLVGGPTRQAMQAMVERTLGPLLKADSDGAPNLVQTMHTYLTNNRHLEHTATALHVHPNTVRYRVSRAQELLDVNLRNADESFLLELALRVQWTLERAD